MTKQTALKKYGSLTASKMTLKDLENLIFEGYKSKSINKEIEEYFKNDLFSKEEAEALGKALVRVMYDQNICTIGFWLAEQALPLVKHLKGVYKFITSKYLFVTKAGGLNHFVLTVESYILKEDE